MTRHGAACALAVLLALVAGLTLPAGTGAALALLLPCLALLAVLVPAWLAAPLA